MLSNSDENLREEECEEVFTEARKKTRVAYKEIGKVDDDTKGAIRMAGPTQTQTKNQNADRDHDSDDMDLDDIWGPASLAKCSKLSRIMKSLGTDKSSCGKGASSSRSIPDSQESDDKPCTRTPNPKRGSTSAAESGGEAPAKAAKMTKAKAAAAVEAGELVLVECKQLLGKLSDAELLRSIKAVSSEAF